MRDYSKISDQFWTGRTGKALRGNMQAQIVALYLMTSPHANMIGAFYCPTTYIAHDTGSTPEGASKGLQRLSEVGFCTYEEDTDLVWVHEMARFQIGDELKPNDNRVKDIQKQYGKLREGPIKQGFYAKYRTAYHLDQMPPDGRPFEAPSKPLRSQKQEQEQYQEQEKTFDASPTATPPTEGASSNGTRLPAGWTLPNEWRDWTISERPTMTKKEIDLEAEKFADYWRGKAGANARKADWFATWRNWIRNMNSHQAGKPRRPTPENFDDIDYGEGGLI